MLLELCVKGAVLWAGEVAICFDLVLKSVLWVELLLVIQILLMSWDSLTREFLAGCLILSVSVLIYMYKETKLYLEYNQRTRIWFLWTVKTPAISLQEDNEDICTNSLSLICNEIFVDLLRYANYLQLDAGGTQFFYRSPGHQVEPLCQLCLLYIKTLFTTPLLGFPLFSLYAGGELGSTETSACLLHFFFFFEKVLQI